jgi:hypothetical protein
LRESIGKKQRKLIQPVFTKANLSCWLIPFKTILAELKNIKTGKPMDVPVFNDLAFQTVIKSIFNINILVLILIHCNIPQKLLKKCWFKN